LTGRWSGYQNFDETLKAVPRSSQFYRDERVFDYALTFSNDDHTATGNSTTVAFYDDYGKETKTRA